MARTTTGHIYTAGKKGNYYLRFKTNGKDCRIRLLNPDGKPITTRPEAVKAAARFLRPIQETDRAEQLRILKNNLQDAEESAAIAEKELKNGKAAISNGWTLFMTCPSRPASCKRFPADQIPRHSTPGNYAGYYRQFTDWIRQHHPEIILLADITPDIANEFFLYLDRITASGTFNKIIQFFKMFFNTLLEDEKIECRNPFQKIRRKEQESNSRRPLTVEQIARLIQETSGEEKLLIAIGYFCGLRFGDCCTLLWNEIDLERGIIERIPRKTRHTRKNKDESAVKIGISPYLMQMLEQIPPEARTGYLLPEIGKAYDNGQSANLTRRILRAFDRAGIQTHKAGTGRIPVTDENGDPVIDKKTGKPKMTGSRAIVEIGFHSLRYSYISHNAERGTPAAVIQKNAGHSNPAMTEHYVKITDSAAVQYAAALSLPAPDENIIDAEILPPDAESDPNPAPLDRLQKMIQTLTADQIEKVIDFIEKIGKKSGISEK